MKEQQPSLRKTLQPYLFISVAGLLAYAPVSFMLSALKNDIVALEYPINYFISQSVRHGEIPYWFNTWGMGFPLQSNLTWGIFSTPQMLFSSIFDYNIYVLHIEFMFFLLLSGWSMFHLLHKYLLKDQAIAKLLAICYMLSGFMVGSTQWLLYITAAAFIPLVISSLLQLLKFPSLKHSIQFAVVYTLMFTSVYAAFNIITTYSLVIFLSAYFIQKKNAKKTKFLSLRYLVLAGVFTILLCSPCLYFTLELLKNIDRGSGIEVTTSFFNSNYLHPAALSSMLLPFSSVRMNFPNTEGTMLNTYVGLFILVLLPAAISKIVKEKKYQAQLMLAAAILFLIISFGDTTPLRAALNILPGLSYFRNPAIFRLYFIISLILFLSMVYQNTSFEKLFNFKTSKIAKLIRVTTLLLMTLCLAVFFVNLKYINSFSFDSLSGLIKNITLSQTILISSIIQFIILGLLLLIARARYFKLAMLILTADLIVNTLLCTPFFSVSSYSLPQVNRILHSEAGFPVQSNKLNKVAATYTDEKRNTWNNVNVFSKQISSNNSYWGPLILKDFSFFSDHNLNSTVLFDKPVIFTVNDTTRKAIKLVLQRPNHISALVKLDSPSSLTLLQNYYFGWKAFYNDKEIDIFHTDKPGITTAVIKGEGIIDFRYERKGAWISALLVHILVLIFLLWKGYLFFKRNVFKSSSLS